MVVKLGHAPGTPPRYRDLGPSRILRHAYSSLDTPLRRAELRALGWRLPLVAGDPHSMTSAELGDFL